METPARPSLLIVDDDVSFVRAAAEIARTIPYDITVADTVRQAEHWLRREAFDLALVDLVLPDGSGLDLVSACARRATAVVLATGHPTVESAVQACRTSLLDYLIKPIDPARFRELLERTAQRRRLPTPIPTGGWHGIVGSSAALCRLVTQIQRVAPTDASVLMLGENGVGKRLAARAIHTESGRSGPFLEVSCSGLAPDALAAQLFGQADDDDGDFERARDGTLFLDDVTALPPPLQLRLLHAIERAPADRGTRVISASGPEPRMLADDGLREELCYRLGEFPIAIPPLRERLDDVTALANHFLAQANDRHRTRKAFTGEAIEQLRRYSWPGNVRELRNVVGYAYIMSASDAIGDPLGQIRVPEPLQETPSTLTVAVGTTFEEIERRMLMKTLEFFGNDKTKAARALGVSVKTIYNQLARYYNATEPE
ncbi:MAG TPA: sigma-54 dependent transcriptional regulator [Tahibacter sp.]|uniref:sigma-54-dependent transcriptional regulator n=1 Tax=Tahibacter sp. TaxID=2056211 RepID=UPI002BBAEBEF|nr:sigma-54 dependent transcriptional regulator [Tahibacter sp.]HSX61910.1 sigma-54 dependent transcriptional regulator [Tahibacter sp.]